MVLGLLLEFYIAGIAILIQFTVSDCSSDSTAGLVFVAAVRIATASGKEEYIFKALVEPFTDTKKAQLSHSRCINQHGALTKNDELPARSRMGAFSRSTDGLCPKSVLTDQAVDKRCLPDTR